LALALPIMAFGVLYSTLLIAAGGAIAVLAIFGLALEPPDADESDFDPPSDGGEPSKELVVSG
jgi:cytochrome c oxidase subunit 1